MGGLFKFLLFILNQPTGVAAVMNSVDLNNPLTAVSGIGTSLGMRFCRKDLKYPPTTVGGITNRFKRMRL